MRLLRLFAALFVATSAAFFPLLYASTASAAQGVIDASVNEGGRLTLTAPAGTVFTTVLFASYGTPTGNTLGGCHAANSVSIVSSAFLGKDTATLAATNSVFGDPCGGTYKRLNVSIEYKSVTPTTIEAPTALIGTANSDGSVLLSWNAPASGLLPERYAVFFTNTPNTGWGVASTETSILLAPDLFSKTGGWNSNYCFKIRSDHDTYALYSSFSNEQCLYLSDPTPPVIVPVPVESPSASPSSEPVPAPSSSPTPTTPVEPAPLPTPTPTQTVEPSPTPAPSVSSEPLPAPSPTPTPVAPEPSPEPTPSPTPAPSPEPSVPPVPTPQPSPEPSPVIPPPTPSPLPKPEPMPEPAPQPAPEPVPVPEPTPTPSPEPSPEPPVPVEEPPVAPPIESPIEEPLPPTEPLPPVEEPSEPPVEPAEPPVVIEPPVVEPPVLPTPEPEPQNPLPEPLEPPVSEEPTVSEAVKDAMADGKLTEEEKTVVAEALIASVAPGEAVSAADIAAAGLEFKDLPPETPVEVRQDENGNEVIITADVAAALVLLESPSELIGAIFSDPGQALQALGSIGADMSPEEREEAEKMVVAAVIAGGAAMNAAAVAAGSATSGGSTSGGGGSSGGAGASGESKGVGRRKP